MTYKAKGHKGGMFHSHTDHDVCSSEVTQQWQPDSKPHPCGCIYKPGHTRSVPHTCWCGTTWRHLK